MPGNSDIDAVQPLLDDPLEPVRHRHAVVELVVRPPALGGPATGFDDPKIDSHFYCRVILVVEYLLLSTAKTG